MKHRNPIAVLIFSIITLGIYDLFWLAKTKKVLNRETRVHTPTLFLLFIPYIVIAIAIIVAIVIAVHSGLHPQPNITCNNLQPGQVCSATTSSNPGASIAIFIILILGSLLIIPVTFWWFYKYSEAVNEYTRGEVTTVLCFILLWLLRFVGMAILQDKFNKRDLAPSTGGGFQQPAYQQPHDGGWQQPEQPGQPMPPPTSPPAPNPHESNSGYPSVYVPPADHQPQDHNQPPFNQS
ncbi:MAG TPA: DUF4234 domain-containing protein [Candidatus Saccharimonadales bacterium]|nr:DUF4234 domain-containing protein [Candidatus Saccharimonadales bacterium]